MTKTTAPRNFRTQAEARRDAREAARWAATLPTMAEIAARQAALLAARAGK